MFKRNGVWQLYVPQPKGLRPVQRSTGTMNRTLAARMERMIKELRDVRRWDALALLADQRLTVPVCYDAFAMGQLDAVIGAEASPLALALADGWLRSIQVKDATRDNYRRQIETLVPTTLRGAAITPGWVRDALAGLRFTSGTRRGYFVALSSFCDYLVAHGILPMNPCREKGLVPRPRRNKPRIHWQPSAIDEALCRSVDDNELRAYFALVHGTGAERNAALAMVQGDVDPVAWAVHIPGTKTPSRDRHGVPVDAWARPLLADWLSVHSGGRAGLLFPGLSMDRVNVGHRIARATVSRPDYQLRDARHSVAIRWLVLGKAPLWQVAKWLGHSSQAITAAVYTQFELDDALALLSATASTTSTEAL